jgi:hypothetical protein
MHMVGGLDVVFEQHRYAVQWPARPGDPALTIQLGRDLFNIGISLDNGSKRRPISINRVDPLKISPD